MRRRSPSCLRCGGACTASRALAVPHKRCCKASPPALSTAHAALAAGELALQPKAEQLASCSGSLAAARIGPRRKARTAAVALYWSYDTPTLAASRSQYVPPAPTAGGTGPGPGGGAHPKPPNGLPTGVAGGQDSGATRIGGRASYGEMTAGGPGPAITPASGPEL